MPAERSVPGRGTGDIHAAVLHASQEGSQAPRVHLPTVPGTSPDMQRRRLGWTRTCGLFVALVLLATAYHQHKINTALLEQVRLLRQVTHIQAQYQDQVTAVSNNTTRLSQQLVQGIFGKLGIDPDAAHSPLYDRTVRLETNPPCGGVGGGP